MKFQGSPTSSAKTMPPPGVSPSGNSPTAQNMPERDLIDSFGRRIEYLRVSVTDRCNLKCRYCRPRERFQMLPDVEILSYEEICRVAELFIGLGVNKIRLTGGEPLVRKNIERLVAMLGRLAGLCDLAISTNGIFLAPLAEPLKRAGLKRVNVSLDTMRPGRFRQITGTDQVGAVLKGIEAALQAGLAPVKINTVLLKGINEDEIADFVRMAREMPVEVRFIELMPTRNCFERGEHHFYSNQDAKKKINELADLTGGRMTGAAEVFDIRGGKGRIGFISPLSCAFCSSCNRVRLKANGFMKLCLHDEVGVDLRGPLRAGMCGEKMKDLIQGAMGIKPKEHHLNHMDPEEIKLVMTQVGG